MKAFLIYTELEFVDIEEVWYDTLGYRYVIKPNAPDDIEVGFCWDMKLITHFDDTEIQKYIQRILPSRRHILEAYYKQWRGASKDAKCLMVL